mgnify:CR=1 FL=1
MTQPLIYPIAFTRAIKTMIGDGADLGQEGGFCVDTGGPTNRGITLAELMANPDFDGDGLVDADLDHDGDVDVDDLKLMDTPTAKFYYHSQWWARYGYDRIHNAELAGKVFNLAVNMGPIQAHRILQRALRACGFPLTEDGVLGPLTVSATNNVVPVAVMAGLRCEAAGFYRMLAVKNPAKYGEYINGWIIRAYA